MSSTLQNILLKYTTKPGKTTAITLSYQLFGKPLHEAPIVMINHALTGNSNVTGKGGWWNPIVGPNKVIDTNVFTVLAFNIPGNGFDQVPSNLIENYKDFTASDIAKIFAIALDQLKITQLYAVIGGSVGGGLAWELAALKPNLIEHLVPIASDWKSTDWLIANCYIQEQILNNSSQPLVDARMHAMSLYRTPESFKAKFDRILQKDENVFAVESWLNYHGNVLNDRFQLAAYKMMNQVLKTIDITQDSGNFIEVASKIKSNIHIVTINSDLFFKAKENWDTYVDLKAHKDTVLISEIQSIHGHDAFLMEYEQLQAILETIFKPQEVY
ncbi:MAG: alpha/beta fold hydrolase [Flavobacteriaceae bacterium]|jgi:homoserine O-acetyltransferase/O-succinyltransferase|nr:alpha/beta fold hydrolase [Formosa sp.]MDG1374726.1 alpha/beta fold hydrolase [Flavobacteriaceae bacterium]MDG2499496.1 alpha/beta fold hydrolase [Flavobacteriaceae bacterium]